MGLLSGKKEVTICVWADPIRRFFSKITTKKGKVCIIKVDVYCLSPPIALDSVNGGHSFQMKMMRLSLCAFYPFPV